MLTQQSQRPACCFRAPCPASRRAGLGYRPISGEAVVLAPSPAVSAPGTWRPCCAQTEESAGVSSGVNPAVSKHGQVCNRLYCRCQESNKIIPFNQTFLSQYSSPLLRKKGKGGFSLSVDQSFPPSGLTRPSQTTSRPGSRGETGRPSLTPPAPPCAAHRGRWALDAGTHGAPMCDGAT